MEKILKNLVPLKIRKIEEAEVPELNNWEVAILHWKAQALANIFFGLTSVVIALAYTNFSFSAIKILALLYLVIYTIIFIPFFAFLPTFFLRSVKQSLKKVHQGKEIKKKEILEAIETLLNIPGKISLVIFIAVFFGFTLGVFSLYLGFIPEFMPMIHVVTITGLVIGFIVAVTQAFLNYIFLEEYLRPRVEFFISLYPRTTQRDLRIKKFPLFLKILFLILFTVIAAQMSLAVLFLGKIAISFPQEFKSSLIYVGLLLVLALLYVFIIAVIFTRNLTYPLSRVISWSQEVRGGNFKNNIYIITNDEISEVIDYSKRMVEELEEVSNVLEIKVQARTKELQEIAKNLEGRVQERTMEIQSRIDELEKFQKLAVGRELKMIGLKEELEKLKKEFEKKNRNEN